MALLTLAEMARRLGVSEKTARVIAASLPAVRVGKRNRYPEDAIAAFASGSAYKQPKSAPVGFGA